MRAIRYFLTFYCVFFFAFAKAQNTHPVQFQTPEVSAFNKLIETPVSLSTGIPDIKIPLYTINMRGVEIPIVLKYGGGGIKVEEEATWVGLGWSLDYGGNLSRIQRGMKDEKFFMKSSNSFTISNFLNIPATPRPQFKTQRNERILNAKFGNADYMPDEFYYSALGYSGRMMFSQSQSKFVLFPKEDIKPSYSLSNLNLGGYTTEEFRIDAWNLRLPNGTSLDYGTYGASTDIASGGDAETRNAWSIKTITNIYGDQANFTYEPVSYTSYNLGSETFDVQSKEKFNYINTSTFRTNYLNKIVFPGGRVDFITTSRLDMPTKCLSAVNVYNHDNVLVKKIEFTYSYFSGDYGTMWNMAFINNDYKTKRLKLDKITISGNGVQSINYRFDYYSASNIYSPSKYSASQDFWGYFNGRANSTLIPKSINEYGADRTPSPNDNQVFSLKNIYYPEGGRTEFSYECNTARSFPAPPYLLTPDGSNYSFYVGGIRIKSIKNYNNDGAIATQKFYDYSNELGTTSGWLLSFPSYYEYVRRYEPRADTLSSTVLVPIFDTRLYSTSRIPLQTTGGSFSGYERVTEESRGSIPADNTKSIYYYTFRDSYYDIGAKRTEKELIDANEWLRGKLDSVSYLKNNVPVKKEIYNYYKISPHNTYGSQEDYVEEINTDFISFQALAVGGIVVPTSMPEDFYDPRPAYNGIPRAGFDYYVYDTVDVYEYPMKLPYFKRYTGFDKIKNKRTITYDGLAPVVQQEEYHYGSTPNHHQLTTLESTGSKGNVLKKTTKYPKDMNGEPYATMVQNNIIDVPIERSVFNQDKLVKKNITNYLSWLYPDNEQEQIGSSTLETKISYKYDNKYNLQQLQQINGIKQSYLWDGVSFQYPTAEVINAAFTDVAYTSFEIPDLISNGDGGWSFVGYADTTESNVPVGKRCYPTTVSTTFTKNGLIATKTYEVYYWSKTGAYTVSGSQSQISLKTLNGWTKFMHIVSGVSTVIVSGRAGFIDELKIWPSESSASTYNYTPLGLLVYKEGPNHDTQYYEYDGMERLKNIKDYNKDLVKDISMNYKGIGPTIYKNTQITKYFIKMDCPAGTSTDSIPFTVYENSFSSLISQADADLQARSYLYSTGQSYANTIGACKFYNVEKSAAFAKNDCGSGKSGSSKLYVVPARTHSSSVSQSDADAKADADINANGQVYANTNGQCVIYSSTVNVAYNNQASSYWSVKARDLSTNVLYTSSMGASYSGIVFTSLPTGTYNIEIAPQGPAPSNATKITLNGIMEKVIPANYNGILTFNNVTINSASSNPLIKVEDGFLPIACTFNGDSSWQIQSFNISKSSATQTNISLIASVSLSGNPWTSASTIGYIIGACTPASQRTFNISENGRTWEVVVYPTGQLTVRLLSGTGPSPGTQITFNGSYNL